jgi:type I restriction-modification system DNA methylase subunit
MSLFQKSVEKKYLDELDSKLIDKKYKAFQKYFGNSEIQENIKNSKEEQFQEGFLRELFVNILDYTLNPNPGFNLTTEQKNVSDSKKADGAILKEDSAVAVIELKSTDTTDLDTVESQAFGYKNQHTNCVYVITSNFEKLRFYIQNAVDYIEFDLFNLNKEDFSLLWLCLAKDNLLNDLPQKIKDSSVLEEEDVTKELYADYSKFRREIYNNLVKNNPDTDRLLLFRKTQKLLDRFLFIFFAEDRLLVPANSISQIVEKWKDDVAFGDEKSLYDIFKQYFNILYKGRPKRGNREEIFAYNGGLFAPDETLDEITIDDEILHKHTLNLSKYDFETDIDVNILGHIFEHSLGEIEILQAEIKGENVEQQKTRRKKEGIFYTPKYITKYIVENTVGKLCEEKKAELGIVDKEYAKGRRNRNKKIVKSLDEKLNKYRDWLLSLTILDPACGSGAFLNQTLDFLIKEHQKVDELRAQLLGGSIVFSDITTDILEKNIYGVDLNEESVEIAKLSLWLRTAQKGRKLNKLNKNIKCGNSLIDDPKIAGDKAFDWKKEFPEVFDKGGFDVVIGNPPYVRAELLGEIRNFLQNNYSVFNPSGDLFTYFYEKSFKLLKPKTGLFGFISNTFDKTTAGVTLREYLQSNIKFLNYVDFTEVQIFEGATTYPIILIAQNDFDSENIFQYIKIPHNQKSKIIDIDRQIPVNVQQSTLDKENWSFKSIEGFNIIKKLTGFKTIKSIYGKSYRGLLTGLNEAFIISKKYKNGEHVKPIFEGKELAKWKCPPISQQLILFKSKWTKETYGNDISEEEALDRVTNDFPELIEHILPFKERAKKRHDKGEFFWELRNCSYYDSFEKSKIVFPNLQSTNKFAFDETGAYINAPAVFLPTDDKYLTGILNSKLIWYFLKNICVVRSGGYIEVKPQYFEQIPIPDISEKNKEALFDKTDKIMDLTRENQNTDNKFKRLLSNHFSEIKINKKLNKWFDLSFTDFKKELKKQKFKLTLDSESEWLDYFENQKEKYKDIVDRIQSLEKEIDQKVYELYDLTDKEIKIVEASE